MMYAGANPAKPFTNGTLKAKTQKSHRTRWLFLLCLCLKPRGSMKPETLLHIENLSVEFTSDEGLTRAVEGVNLSVAPGETLGIVGESGSGKSVTALSVMGLLPARQSRIDSGAIWFRHPELGPVNLLAEREKQLQAIRGRFISMVFQEPMTALNPVQRCGKQVAEVLLWHRMASPQQAKNRVLELFDEVKLPDPQKAYHAYPHELSGGQRQRVMIAMAMACDPLLLIADEPTTALDVTVQKNILELMAALQQKHQMAIIFISHDLGVIAQVAKNVAVMLQGRVVESGRVKDIFSHPSHPYTKGLIACRPSLDNRPPVLPVVKDFLEEKPLTGKVAEMDPGSDTMRQEHHRRIYSRQPVLTVEGLKTSFVTRKSWLGKALEHYKAVNDVSFSVFQGETLGLVGESGCGKTTLGRSLMRLIEPGEGRIIYREIDLRTLPPEALRRIRPRFQIIFQDPYSSLTPGMQVGQAIMEPMRVHGILKNDRERRHRIMELLERVNLEEKHFYRYPHEFSGGQRQRIAIARALALNPEFIICDESVSALDVSVQAQVLNLLNEMKKEFDLTYIFISHDLSVVKYMSDRIMVMRHGQLVETAEADQLYRKPQSDYTLQLINAIPKIDA
jgi:peptide/nickel transport system ATP-binding protein